MDNTIQDWFETAVDLMCIMHPDGKIDKFSQSWPKTLGWSVQELEQFTLFDLIHPDDIAQTTKAFQVLEKGQTFTRLENRCKKKDGHYIWLDWHATLKKGDCALIQAIARDITTFKEREQKAQNDIRLLEMAEQTAKLGHWRLDAVSGRLEWSQEVFNIYGRRAHKREITLDDFIDAFSPPHQKVLWTLIQEAIQDGKEINTELILQRDNNDKRTVVIRAFCERDVHQVVQSLFGIIQDVTEERRHQARLRSKQELLSMAFKATSDGIWDWDLKTDQVWLSSQWKKQVGYEDDELANRFETWANLIFEEDRLIAMDKLNDYFQGQSDNFEMIQRFRHKKGHTVFILSRAYAMRDEQNRAIRLIGAHTDVTELKKLEQAKSEFTAIVSHELRTPLTAIHGALGLINGHYKNVLDDQVQSLVQMAYNNCERLTLLVNDILDMDKLQFGRMDFDIQDITLGSFLPTVIDNHLAYAAKFRVTLDYDDSGNDISVRGDANRLMQVMSNLVSNAIKFSHENDTVKIRTRLHDNQVAISIIDTGKGIERDMRERIFEKFIQADSSDQRHKGGTGLGLTIAKSMIEKMNGSITVMSKLNEGSTFTVLLPHTDS